MLKVQEFLRQNSNNIIKLQQDYGVECIFNDNDGRVIFNYSQINSPKKEDMVRECRGLVLDRYNNWELVARSFTRFFNWNEYPEDTQHFNWNDCVINTKEDGSLILLYYYNGSWHINTRGSFGNGKVNDSQYTWRTLFESTMSNVNITALPHYTYVLELCSPYNAVVRAYSEPCSFLLSVFDGYLELPWEEVKALSKRHCFNHVDQHHFTNVDEVNEYLSNKSHSDPTFEGVVLRDNKSRFKIKSIKYVELHKIHNNGNIASPKNLINFILDGEEAELLSYFPMLTTTVNEMKTVLNQEFIALLKVWEESKDIFNQKDFALYVLQHTRLHSLLFQARKTGEELKNIWAKSGKMLVEYLFKE